MGSVFGTVAPHDVTFSRYDILASDDVIDRVREQTNITEIATQAPAPVPPAPPTQTVKQQILEPASEKKADISPPIRQGLTSLPEEADRRFDNLLRRLSERNNMALKVAEEEYAKVVDRLHAKYLTHSPRACCVDARKIVMECYKHNGQRSLNCSKEVESFVRCVAAFRAARANSPTSDIL
ncbi:hypothetical protein Aperf_G00000024536 [Anoplocephala perfoliata]